MSQLPAAPQAHRPAPLLACLQLGLLGFFGAACGGLTSDVSGSGSHGDPYLHPGSAHFIDDFPARTPSGEVNVVVEIPAGTDAKWEVTKPGGELRWQIKDGAPRVVQYLGYPGNYGMIPRTILPKEQGGDGDPLDVLVLGPAQPRGSVIPVRVIGVLELLDGGEQDDKLLAVVPGTPLGDVTSLAELEASYPGVTTIVRTWFENYKGLSDEGQPRMVSQGLGDAARAEAILSLAIKAYAEARKAPDESGREAGHEAGHKAAPEVPHKSSH